MKKSSGKKKLHLFKMLELQVSERQSHKSRPWTCHPLVKMEAFEQMIPSLTAA